MCNIKKVNFYLLIDFIYKFVAFLNSASMIYLKYSLLKSRKGMDQSAITFLELKKDKLAYAKVQ